MPPSICLTYGLNKFHQSYIKGLAPESVSVILSVTLLALCMAVTVVKICFCMNC